MRHADIISTAHDLGVFLGLGSARPTAAQMERLEHLLWAMYEAGEEAAWVLLAASHVELDADPEESPAVWLESVRQAVHMIPGDVWDGSLASLRDRIKADGYGEIDWYRSIIWRGQEYQIALL